MKISPVVGTPSLPQLSNTGLPPEKLARLKAIAEGRDVAVQSAEPVVDNTDPRKRNSITMNTNRTIHREIAPPEENPAEINPDSTISDNNVQANAAAEATQPLSPQFAALARQRRALQVKERELAEKMKAHEGPTRSELEARLKAQPLSVLQELGVTYDQLTNEILASQNGSSADIQALKAEIKALREGVDKTLSDKDAQAEKAVIAEMRRHVDNLSAQGDDFELIRETQSQPQVIDLIYRTYKESGEVMDEAEAMKLVEEELFKEAEKIARLKKVQGRLTPQAPLQPQQPQYSGMRTLTNKDSVNPGMSRRQRAILAAQGNLKR